MRMYNYVRSRQLEDTFNNDPEEGVWITTSMRIMKGWGNPSESDWPYDGDAKNWPPQFIPPNIDSLAKKGRIGAYQRIRSLTDCKIVIASGHYVIAGLEITNQWWGASEGIITMPRINEEKIGGHAVTLIGYDDKGSSIKFINSWGDKWGDKGTGKVPYDFFEKYLVEAWAITLISSKPDNMPQDGLVELEWGINEPLGGILHGIEIYDATNDEYVGWVFALERERLLDVEEFFVRPQYRLQGKGKNLMQRLSLLSESLNLPLRFWIPHADRLSIEILYSIIGETKFIITESDVKWAAYKATQK